MDQRSTDHRSRRHRRSPAPYFRIISDLPVTDAEVRLFVAMLGAPDGVRRILEGGEVTLADVDAASALGHRCKKPPH